METHQFRKLFLEQLGWDRANGNQSVHAGDRDFQLELVAQKRGFLILASHVHRTVLANRKLLRTLQRQVVRQFHEHIVVCFSEQPFKQVWQWAVHLPDGRKLRHREHPFLSDNPPNAFVERLERLEFTFDEEEEATLTDAISRVRQALDTKSDFDLFARYPEYAEESDRLAMAMRNGVPGAFDEFVVFHQRLGRRASRMLIRWVGMEPEDAEQIAMLGLMEAARRFDFERGYQFSTLAGHWIKQSCQRYGANTGLPIRIPVHAFWPCYRLQFEYNQLLATHGPGGADELFKDKLRRHSITIDQWSAFQRSYDMIRLSDATDDEFREFRARPDTTAGPERRAISSETRSIMLDALDQMEDRDAHILKLRYGLSCKEHTLEEVATKYNVTRERVRQIQARAEDRLKRLLPKSEAELLVQPNRPTTATIQKSPRVRC